MQGCAHAADEQASVTKCGCTWTIAPVPYPANGAQGSAGGLDLYAVACPDTTNCVAVGDYQVPLASNADQMPLIETGTATTT
jgi:hypothetical protein